MNRDSLGADLHMISHVPYAVFCNISFELLISMLPHEHPNHRCIIKLGIAKSIC